jgi:putative (di)nucleoside polyphosphate hydrolase
LLQGGKRAVPNVAELDLKLPLRTGVGILLLNREGRAWLGRRAPKWLGTKSAFIWQLPQGGIDRDEAPVDAALRELEEETGATSVEVIAETPDWLSYELPGSLLGRAMKGRYRGQRQKWFAMRFHGSDREIDIRPRNGHKAEFDGWQWASPQELPALAVPFKRPMYETLLREFAPLIRYR